MSGVEREPGQTTASVTPRRAHSSTRVAQKVACTLTGRAPPCRRARVRTAAGGAARLYPDGTPVGPLRRPPGAGSHGDRGGPARSRRFWARAGRPAGDGRSRGGGGAGSGGRRGADAARLLAGRPRGAPRGDRDGAPSARGRLHRPDRRHRGSRALGSAGVHPTTPWPTSSRHRAMSRASLRPGCTAPCSSTWTPRLPIARNACATARPVWHGASGSAGRERKRPCGICCPRSPPPSWPWPARTTSVSPRTRWRVARLAPHARRVPGPGRRSCGASGAARADRQDRPSLARHGRVRSDLTRLDAAAAQDAAAAEAPAASGQRLHRSSPIVSSAPVRIWRRAVVPSIGSKARPSWSLSASRRGAMATGVAAIASSDHGR